MNHAPAISPTSPIGARPRFIHLHHRGDSLLIWFRWRSAQFAALLIAALALAVSALAVAVSGSWDYKVAAFVATVPAVPGIALGVIGLFNRTILEVSPDSVRSSHRPFGWPGAQILPARQILQLYTTQFRLGSRGGTFARLWAAMADGRRVPLTWYMLIRNPDNPRWIETQIETTLHIVDRPIHCPTCGYDLRVTHTRCPECGVKLPATKRQRRAWKKAIDEVIKDRPGSW